MKVTRFTSRFSEKIIFQRKRPILGLKMVEIFEILPNERGQQVHGNYINGFFEKILI